LRGLRLAGLVLLLAQAAVCAAQGVSIVLEDGLFKVKGWKAPAVAPAQG
jgi:hypothetical protein